MATGIDVESNVRKIFELGYELALAVGAMTDMSPEANTHNVGADHHSEGLIPKIE